MDTGSKRTDRSLRSLRLKPEAVINSGCNQRVVNNGAILKWPQEQGAGLTQQQEGGVLITWQGAGPMQQQGAPAAGCYSTCRSRHAVAVGQITTSKTPNSKFRHSDSQIVSEVHSKPEPWGDTIISAPDPLQESPGQPT